MLSIVIDNIKKYGFINFTLTTFYKSKLIKTYLKTKNLDVSIDYVQK